MTTYQIGLTELTLADAKTLFGTYPRSSYAPGAELVSDHGGGLVPVGYPRSVWTWTAIPVATYTSVIQTTLAFATGTYSGEVYVVTRDEFDAWATYRAYLRLPNPATLDRWGSKYRNVSWELVLLEDVT